MAEFSRKHFQASRTRKMELVGVSCRTEISLSSGLTILLSWHLWGARQKHRHQSQWNCWAGVRSKNVPQKWEQPANTSYHPVLKIKGEGAGGEAVFNVNLHGPASLQALPANFSSCSYLLPYTFPFQSRLLLSLRKSSLTQADLSGGFLVFFL